MCPTKLAGLLDDVAAGTLCLTVEATVPLERVPLAGRQPSGLRYLVRVEAEASDAPDRVLPARRLPCRQARPGSRALVLPRRVRAAPRGIRVDPAGAEGRRSHGRRPHATPTSPQY